MRGNSKSFRSGYLTTIADDKYDREGRAILGAFCTPIAVGRRIVGSGLNGHIQAIIRDVHSSDTLGARVGVDPVTAQRRGRRDSSSSIGVGLSCARGVSVSVGVVRIGRSCGVGIAVCLRCGRSIGVGRARGVGVSAGIGAGRARSVGVGRARGIGIGCSRDISVSRGRGVGARLRRFGESIHQESNTSQYHERHQHSNQDDHTCR